MNEVEFLVSLAFSCFDIILTFGLLFMGANDFTPNFICYDSLRVFVVSNDCGIDN